MTEKNQRPPSHRAAARLRWMQTPAKQPAADSAHTAEPRITLSAAKYDCQGSHTPANTRSIPVQQQREPSLPEPVPKKRRIKKTAIAAGCAAAETAVPLFLVVSSSNRLTSLHPMRGENGLCKCPDFAPCETVTPEFRVTWQLVDVNQVPFKYRAIFQIYQGI